MVPATIGFETPNPNIAFNELNIEVVTKNRPLKKNGKLVIGVNSFGFGGANAHVILESHEQPKSEGLKNPQTPFCRSCFPPKTVALKQAAGEFSCFLEKTAPVRPL